MLTWIIIAASAAASLPKPVEAKDSPASWVRATDLPEIDENAAVTTFDLTVDASGHPAGCSIIVRSGSEQLDAAVCKSLMQRASFKPSKGSDGSNTASIYRERVVWLPNAGGSNYWFKGADIVVATTKLPKVLKQVAEVLVITDGHDGPSTCLISKSVGIASLDEMACSVATDPKISPPITIQGVQVSGVRLLRVGFEPGSIARVTIR